MGVNSRDIRSIDYAQQKLEAELRAKGLFYERKKNQHSNQASHLKLDAEKVGQVLFAFYNKMPAEAKDKKRLIFAEKYEEIFNDEINADKVLLAYRLFENIDSAKDRRKSEILSISGTDFEEESFVLYASYYILYILSELSKRKEISLSLDKLNEIWSLYPEAIQIIRQLIKIEKETVKESYAHAPFFVSSKPKKIFEDNFK